MSPRVAKDQTRIYVYWFVDKNELKVAHTRGVAVEMVYLRPFEKIHIAMRRENRRDFLKRAAGAAVVLGAARTLSRPDSGARSDSWPRCGGTHEISRPEKRHGN